MFQNLLLDWKFRSYRLSMLNFRKSKIDWYVIETNQD
jgi:hypothetical protein